MDEIEILREQMGERFEKWQEARQKAFELRQRNWHREGEKDFSDAWATHAFIQELSRDRMGKELNKLQSRIHRQREANRKLQWRIKELEAIVKKQQQTAIYAIIEEGKKSKTTARWLSEPNK